MKTNIKYNNITIDIKDTGNDYSDISTFASEELDD